MLYFLILMSQKEKKSTICNEKEERSSGLFFCATNWKDSPYDFCTSISFGVATVVHETH